MKRTIDDTIEEMKSIKDYFEKETDGSCPICILESIEILTAKKDYRQQDKWIPVSERLPEPQKPDKDIYMTHCSDYVLYL